MVFVSNTNGISHLSLPPTPHFCLLLPEQTEVVTFNKYKTKSLFKIEVFLFCKLYNQNLYSLNLYRIEIT